MVHRAFDKIDKRGANAIDPEDLIANYNYENHPDVLTTKRTKDEILKEFLDTFDVGGIIPGKVTRDEFINYYTNLNASIQDDDYMEVMLRRSWSLGSITNNNNKNTTQNLRNEISKNENSLLSRIRNAQEFSNQAGDSDNLRRPVSASAIGKNHISIL